MTPLAVRVEPALDREALEARVVTQHAGDREAAQRDEQLVEFEVGEIRALGTRDGERLGDLSAEFALDGHERIA